MTEPEPTEPTEVTEQEEETDEAEAVREAVERSRSGAPAVGETVRDRFSSDEVFQRIIAAADEEINSGRRELFFSALAAGLALTITFLVYAAMYAATDGHPVLKAILYPIGFVYIIIGGYQLYTENTLPPVALTLERLSSWPTLFRHWVIVLLGNFAGGAIGAMVLAWGGVFSPEAAEVAIGFGQEGIETGRWPLFFKGAVAGLVVAGVVWLDYSVTDSISRLLIVYLAFLVIPLGNLFHVVISFTELFYLVLLGEASFLVGMTDFVIPVGLGNTIGGVVLVTVVNYYQTTERRPESPEFESRTRRLSNRELLFGRAAGRSYVPAIDTAGPVTVADDDQYRVVVPISNPRTEQRLIQFACDIASASENATVHAVHVVQVPNRMSLQYDRSQRSRIVGESRRLLRDVGDRIATGDVEFVTSTVVSSRSFEEVFDAARRKQADLVVMGWGDDKLWGSARAERPIDELTNRLPCDFLVLKDRDLDASRILLPTAGGPDSDLAAEVVHALRSTVGSAVSLLHVVNGPDQREPGEEFLRAWADDHELGDAELTVDDSGDVEGAIARAAEDRTLVVIGATERGLLSRLATDSIHMRVLDEVDCSVLLAERPSDRSLFQRLFGR